MREEGREEAREEMREEGREGGREGGNEGGKEGGRERECFGRRKRNQNHANRTEVEILRTKVVKKRK